MQNQTVVVVYVLLLWGKAFAENSNLTSCFPQKKVAGLYMELYSIIKDVFDTHASLYEE